MNEAKHLAYTWQAESEYKHYLAKIEAVKGANDYAKKLEAEGNALKRCSEELLTLLETLKGDIQK